MFRTRTLVLILGVLFLFSPSLSAATNVWARHYPKRDKAGDILIKGTATADTGFTLTTGTGTGTAVVWQAGKNGGVITTVAIDIAADGTWSATLTGFDPTVRYNVVVQVTETMSGACCTTISNTIATQPVVTRAREDDDDRDRD